MNYEPKVRGWIRRLWDERDREFFVKRWLLLLIAGPTGALLGGAGAAADSDERWWPWLVGGIAWFALSLVGSVAIWHVLFASRPTHTRRQ